MSKSMERMAQTQSDATISVAKIEAEAKRDEAKEATKQAWMTAFYNFQSALQESKSYLQGIALQTQATITQALLARQTEKEQTRIDATYARAALMSADTKQYDAESKRLKNDQKYEIDQMRYGDGDSGYFYG